MKLKNLAEQTASSADDIKARVASLTSVTGEISSLMKNVSGAVAEGRERLTVSQAAIEHIRQKLRNRVIADAGNHVHSG